MNLKRFLIPVFLFVILTCIALVFLRTLGPKYEKNSGKTVFIRKNENSYQLIRNGSPFTIRGAAGNSNFELLASINGNTIRLYDTINLAEKLNEAQKFNLAVIVDIPIPAFSDKYSVYDDPIFVADLKKKVLVLVNKTKQHPALLFWNLGNELKYPLVFKKNNFINTFNELIQIIHEADVNHPIATTISGTDYKQVSSLYLHSPELDFISYNIFAHLKKVKKYLTAIEVVFGERPYYISEWGPNGHWEGAITPWGAPYENSTTTNIKEVKERYQIIKNNYNKGCLGSLYFYWGSKQEVTHTWFSLFNSQNKSEIIKVLASLWRKSTFEPKTTVIESILLNDDTKNEKNIVLPEHLQTAELLMKNYISDNQEISWEIYPEDWHYPANNKNYAFTKINATIVPISSSKIQFISPKDEGAYRLFVYVVDKEGYYATANAPFYVLKK